MHLLDCLFFSFPIVSLLLNLVIFHIKLLLHRDVEFLKERQIYLELLLHLFVPIRLLLKVKMHQSEVLSKLVLDLADPKVPVLL